MPQNDKQPLVEVKIDPPRGIEYPVTDGVYARQEVTANIEQAVRLLEEANPDKIITLGGNCLVSQVPFDYLHGKYKNVGVIWIDTHPDVSTVKDGYPNSHAKFLKDVGVDFKIQRESFLSHDEIKQFMSRFDHILVHLDIDVLDAKLFHSTYFANPELVGDGSGSGRMTMAELGDILQLIFNNSDVVGLTIAEYLPFDEHKLSQMFEGLDIFKD